MRLQFCSDLHLEFPENAAYMNEHPLVSKADILIIAGDLVPFTQLSTHLPAIKKICQPFQQVYWVPGNHEYYYNDVMHRSGSFEEKILPNLTLLNNKSITIDQVELIFSTLWTHISIEKSLLIQNRLSDFFTIKNNAKTLDAVAYNQMHNASLSYIRHALEHSQDKKQVVITHHCPTFRNYPQQFVNSPINEAFAVELETMIEETKPAYWIHGHTHINTPTFQLGITQMCTNQLGYVRRGEHGRFLKDAVMEL
jgi:Icc-related predicted phosphoesterase